MKIGYYLGNASIEGGGTSPYTWRVLDLILNRSKNAGINIVILCSKNNQESCLRLIAKYNVNVKIAIMPQFNLVQKFINKLSDFGAENLVKQGLSEKWIRKFNFWFLWYKSLNLDLLHIPIQTTLRYDIPYPFIITMHDVQQIHYPEFFTPEERAYRAEHYWKSLKYSSAVVVSFNHVKNDLIKYFRIPSQKVSICPPTYHNVSLQIPSLEEEKLYENLYKSYDEFLLYPAQTWEHKNHISLIKALEIIQSQYNKSIHLVCSGRKNPDFFPIIESYLSKSSVSNQVHFLDIVPEQELYWLYKNCSLVVIPTLYEGLGFPLLEAMSLQVPVICSSVTSLPDTINDSRFTFDPLNIESIADLIIKILENTEFRQENIQNSINRMKELREIDSFPYYLELWNKVITEKS